MSQNARPNADVYVEGWSPTPVYKQIDEVPPPNDSTYVTSGSMPGPWSFEVHLDPRAFPIVGPPWDGSAVPTHALTARMDGQWGASAMLTLLQAVTGEADRFIGSEWFDLHPGFANYTLTLTRHQAALIDDYTALKAVVTVFTGSSSSSSSSSSNSSGSSSSGSAGSIGSTSAIQPGSANSTSGGGGGGSGSAGSGGCSCGCQGGLPSTLTFVIQTVNGKYQFPLVFSNGYWAGSGNVDFVCGNINLIVCFYCPTPTPGGDPLTCTCKDYHLSLGCPPGNCNPPTGAYGCITESGTICSCYPAFSWQLTCQTGSVLGICCMNTGTFTVTITE